ncbi:transcriptional regulator, LysR family [Methylocella silvestris BL2]|uniref:Transcriptional regulator, LysR family n=1 Tax=Methylocella silvestris (strain DSM 15510 / CIP 108128 / LMG 27833 / NCIMB 13906 / BL2) TaxID=395965 RepID=B8ERS8_METSB|nr:LysR substrate-binding domain-containing protein [Methylocella silvestris]ACK51626.1 transcriptional regulator, LysR family [Methylocella silvestris BL2]
MVRIRTIDLNLLRVFEAVMRHRSVIRASRELGVTASAVSHALSRLRQALGDELFISGEAGMEPTARALELEPAIRDGLERIDHAVGAQPFVPTDAFRTFRIAATDYVAVAILPQLVGRLAEVAPQIDLRIFPFNRTDVVRHLDEGRIDFVMGWFGDLPDRMRRATIVVEKEAMVVRTGHPLTEGPLTKERLFSFPHIVVELIGTEEAAVDGFFDDRGVWRRVWIERLLIEADADQGEVGRVAVSVPHYAAVPPMVRVSDMVATLPSALARAAVEQGSLVMLDLPYEPLAVPVEMVWHQRTERDEGSQWLLGELISAVKPAAVG